MSRGILDELTLKKKSTHTIQSGTNDRENGTVPKRTRPIMAEMDCGVHSQNSGGQTQNVRFTVGTCTPFGGTRNPILTDIDCMC